MYCICWYNKRKIWSLKFADVQNPDDRWYVSMCYMPVLTVWINPLNTELNPICNILALLGAHPILHVSGLRVKENHK
jgi:hypothetical protein